MQNRASPKDNLRTPTDLDPKQIKPIAEALNRIIADTFSLYVKTKNFHWHMSGPHFRDYHLLLDDQGEEIYRDHRSPGRARAQTGRNRR